MVPGRSYALERESQETATNLGLSQVCQAARFSLPSRHLAGCATQQAFSLGLEEVEVSLCCLIPVWGPNPAGTLMLVMLGAKR
jgi:hypothetical protein